MLDVFGPIWWLWAFVAALGIQRSVAALLATGLGQRRAHLFSYLAWIACLAVGYVLVQFASRYWARSVDNSDHWLTVGRFWALWSPFGIPTLAGGAAVLVLDASLAIWRRYRSRSAPARELT
jgi:hypothetical protein